jgi:PAS domain S-box-containing protein
VRPVDAQRWSAARRADLVLRILAGKTTVSDAAARHHLPASEVEEWVRRFREGGEAALRAERPTAHPRPSSLLRLESILDNTTAVIYVKDLEGRYALVNRQFELLFHVTREAARGRTDYDLFTRTAAEAFRENDRKVVAAGAPIEFEEVAPHDDGPHTYISLKFPLFDDHGKIDAVCGISTDITERKRTEERLQQVTAELRAFYQAQPDLAFRLASDGTILDYKAGQASALYLPPEQFLGRRMSDVLPPDASRLLGEAIARVREAGTELATTEYVLPMPDGREHHFEARLTPLEDRRILVLVRDISARKRAEESLRLLARRLVTVREEERERLGFDLHDGVCQELAGIGILVAAARADLGSAQADAADKLEQVGKYLQEMMDHIRLLAHELRPMLLHELGLEESLRSLATGFSAARRRIAIHLAEHLPRLEEPIEVAVYRIAQEALINAARHAAARLTTLTLAPHGDTLRLVVQDNGRGFDPRDGGTIGTGIASMEHRALALGARFDLRSEPGRGTTVTFECPLRVRQDPVAE